MHIYTIYICVHIVGIYTIQLYTYVLQNCRILTSQDLPRKEKSFRQLGWWFQLASHPWANWASLWSGSNSEQIDATSWPLEHKSFEACFLMDGIPKTNLGFKILMASFLDGFGGTPILESQESSVGLCLHFNLGSQGQMPQVCDRLRNVKHRGTTISICIEPTFVTNVLTAVKQQVYLGNVRINGWIWVFIHHGTYTINGIFVKEKMR